MEAISKIKVTKTAHSKVSDVDFDNLPFGRVFSDHMFIMTYNDGKWGEPEIRPTQKLEVHPSNVSWHYGQAIFEGMKAFKNKEGRPVLYRPEDHAKRFNKSAIRMSMPPVDESLFVEAVSELVSIERDWIPPAKGSALYLRPFMFAADEYIGVNVAQSYHFIIITVPVTGLYDRPVKLYADKEHVRAVPGGVGEAKTAGNYAAALLPSKKAKELGYDQVLWLDAVHREYIEEVGTMNIFFVFDDEIVTPELTGSILRGITRDSFLQIMRDEADVPVNERRLSIHEVIAKSKEGKLKEVFGAGTAAVSTSVDRIHYDGQDIEISMDRAYWGPYLKSTIEDIRAGDREDKYGWIRVL